MRLTNRHGVVVNVPDELGESLIASGTYTEDGSKSAKQTAAQKKAAAKQEAGDQGENDDAGK